MGEGAGSNVCLRAASEVAQRRKENFRSTNIVVSGIVLICGQSCGLTVGNYYASALAATMLKRGWRSSAALGLLGATEDTVKDEKYISSMESLDASDIASYAQAFYTPGMRKRVHKRRTESLKNVPSLMLLPETASVACKRAMEIESVLDMSRSSGAVPIKTQEKVNPNYVAGGGALLHDQVGRYGVINSMKMFLEGL